MLLRRTVDTTGKSRAWINGSPATATQLRELGEQLLDIHGQHAWQSLTRSDAVRALLDGYAGIDTTAATQAWTQWRLRRKALETATERQSTLHQESDGSITGRVGGASGTVIFAVSIDAAGNRTWYFYDAVGRPSFIVRGVAGMKRLGHSSKVNLQSS